MLSIPYQINDAHLQAHLCLSVCICKCYIISALRFMSETKTGRIADNLTSNDISNGSEY